jgi:hypothetical protein
MGQVYPIASSQQTAVCFTTPASGGPARLSSFRQVITQVSAADSATFYLYRVAANWETFTAAPVASDVVTSPMSCAADLGINNQHWETALALPNIFAAALLPSANYCVGIASNAAFFGSSYGTCSVLASAYPYGSGLIRPSGFLGSALLYKDGQTLMTRTAANFGTSACFAATFA